MNTSATPDSQQSAAAELRGLGAIRLSGEDAASFLQGQLTQDVAALTPSEPRLAGWTSAKGRLLCIATLLNWQEALWLIVPRVLLNPVQQRLRMFVLRAKVAITTPDVQVSINEKPSELIAISYCINKDNSLDFRCQNGPHLRLATAESTADNDLATEQRWRRQNIALGIPTVWPATSESFVPQMLNLDLLAAISFSKGCYVGQEIVARTQNLGRIKRRMYAFSSAQSAQAQAGDRLYLDGQDAGQIVDACQDDSATSLLAVVRIEQCQETFSLDAAGTLPLTLGELPYPVPLRLD